MSSINHPSSSSTHMPRPYPLHAHAPSNQHFSNSQSATQIIPPTYSIHSSFHLYPSSSTSSIHLHWRHLPSTIIIRVTKHLHSDPIFLTIHPYRKTSIHIILPNLHLLYSFYHWFISNRLLPSTHRWVYPSVHLPPRTSSRLHQICITRHIKHTPYNAEGLVSYDKCLSTAFFLRPPTTQHTSSSPNCHPHHQGLFRDQIRRDPIISPPRCRTKYDTVLRGPRGQDNPHAAKCAADSLLNRVKQQAITKPSGVCTSSPSWNQTHGRSPSEGTAIQSRPPALSDFNLDPRHERKTLVRKSVGVKTPGGEKQHKNGSFLFFERYFCECPFHKITHVTSKSVTLHCKIKIAETESG